MGKSLTFARNIPHDVAGESKGIQYDNMPNIDDAGVPVSISIWVERTEAQTAAQHFIYCDQTTSDTDDAGVRFYGASGGTVTFDIKTDGSFPTKGSDNSLGLGDLRHFVCTWDGVTTNAPKMYQDGVLLGAGTAGSGTRLAAPGSHSIGGREFTQARGAGMIIAGFGRWTRVLTAIEVKMLVEGLHPLYMHPEDLVICPDFQTLENLALNRTSPRPNFIEHDGGIYAGPPKLRYERPKFAHTDVPADKRLVPVKKPWTRKPPVGTQIDRSHPMVKDMFFFCAMDRVGDQVNLIDGVIGVQDISGAATAILKTTPYGIVGDFELSVDAEWSGYNWGNRPEYQPTELTIITRARPETESHGGGSRIVSKQTGSSDDYSIYYGSNSEEWHYRINGQDDVLNPVGPIGLGGRLYDLALSVNTFDQYNYAWEVELGDKMIRDQNASGATVAQNTGPLCIGIRGNSQERMFDGEIHYVAMWNKWRDQDFITAFRKNPWQIFEPETIMVPHAEALPELAKVEKPW